MLVELSGSKPKGQ